MNTDWREYPRNRREMDKILAAHRREKWMVRSVAWPLIIGLALLADVIVCRVMDLHEQSARLIVGMTIGGIAARVMAWF